MMFVLQLVLYVMIGTSFFCAGMDKQEFTIGLVSDARYTDTKLKSGILEIYYDETKDYKKCARFISGQEIFTLLNFNEERKQFIERKIKETDPIIWKYRRAPEALCVTQINYTGDNLELLDIPYQSKPVLMLDKIILDRLNICHGDNIEAIRQALALNKPFIINVIHRNNYNIQPDKIMVKEYANESYFYWSKESILVSDVDPGSFSLGNCLEKQQVVDIDLDKEKAKSLSDQSDKRFQWGGRLFWMTLGALILYKMRNNIHIYW